MVLLRIQQFAILTLALLVGLGVDRLAWIPSQAQQALTAASHRQARMEGEWFPCRDHDCGCVDAEMCRNNCCCARKSYKHQPISFVPASRNQSEPAQRSAHPATDSSPSKVEPVSKRHVPAPVAVVPIQEEEDSCPCKAAAAASAPAASVPPSVASSATNPAPIAPVLESAADDHLWVIRSPLCTGRESILLFCASVLMLATSLEGLHHPPCIGFLPHLNLMPPLEPLLSMTPPPPRYFISPRR